MSASEATAQSDTRANSSDSGLPQLTRYSPLPCVRAGTSFSIHGSNFDKLTDRDNFSLAIELNGQHQPVEFQLKDNTHIVATLPALLENIISVRVGLIPNKNWQQNSLKIQLCSSHAETNQSSSARSNNRQESQRESQGDPDLATDDAATYQDTNKELQQRIANSQTEGSLIGSGLPGLPQELRLKQSNDSTTYVSNELIAVSVDIDQSKQLANIMSQYQARATRRKNMKALGMVLTTFRLPPGIKVSDTLEQLRNSHPEIWIDANHFYTPNAKTSSNKKQSNDNNRAKLFGAIGLPQNQLCHSNIKIGILDGPIDQTIESLTTQSITQKQMFSRGKKPASASHGTAIASLLVGSSKFPELSGVISHAQLVAGVVMQENPKDKKKAFSTTESLILGLNWLVEQQVSVINLSLGGPRNALLEVALMKVLELDIGIVAAAGNGGRKAPKSYPAAQSGIIAVSALDFDTNLAEDATQGDYIGLSAPGVDLWVASDKTGARYLSGSSLAAPLVAAALAQLGGSPDLSGLLFKSSKDLGDPGKDSQFGWGLLQFPACKS